MAKNLKNCKNVGKNCQTFEKMEKNSQTFEKNVNKMVKLLKRHGFTALQVSFVFVCSFRAIDGRAGPVLIQLLHLTTAYNLQQH